jgi:Na+/phosphate symporter
MEPQRPAGLTRSLEAAFHQACSVAIELVERARDGFARLDASALERSDQASQTLRRDARALMTGILSEVGNRPGFSREARAFLTVPTHLERMADLGEALVADIGKLRAEGLPFTDRARSEIAALMTATVEVLGALRDMVRTWSPVLARHVVEAADRAEAYTDEVAQDHRDRMVGGECVPRSSPVYLAILDHLSSIRRHAREMALDLHRGAMPPA